MVKKCNLESIFCDRKLALTKINLRMNFNLRVDVVSRRSAQNRKNVILGWPAIYYCSWLVEAINYVVEKLFFSVDQDGVFLELA